MIVERKGCLGIDSLIHSKAVWGVQNLSNLDEKAEENPKAWPPGRPRLSSTVHLEEIELSWKWWVLSILFGLLLAPSHSEWNCTAISHRVDQSAPDELHRAFSMLKALGKHVITSSNCWILEAGSVLLIAITHCAWYSLLEATLLA